MGSWGFESCSSDGCWDALGQFGIDNIHNMKQEEIDRACSQILHCIKNNKNPYGKKVHYNEDRTEIIGCIIWFLRHGFNVGKDVLEAAIPFANAMSEKEDYNSWSDPEERKREVKKECDQIANAYENDGTIPKEHIPGLFENLTNILG